MNRTIIQTKSEDFAVRIIDFYEILKERKVPFRILEQIVGSGTSIGANAFEAKYGFSDNDFLAKLSISLKECSETLYWLRILHRTKYISAMEFASLNKDAEEILKMLIASIKTLKKRLGKD